MVSARRAAVSLAAVAIVTGAIFGLRSVAPVLSLGVLYLFAVLPVAALWGLRFALPVSIGSMLTFNWFFLPPTHTFQLADSENWVALAVYLLTALSVSGLADRAQRRTKEAEQQRREAALAADVSAILLESRDVQSQSVAIAARVAASLGTSQARIELGSPRHSEPNERAHDLTAGGRHVGRLFLQTAAAVDPEIVVRVIAVVASLLATAIEREQLARDGAAKTAILRSVSHDLRSPITAIATASEVLQRRGELSTAEREELLASIRFQAGRLDRLVSNLLDLSRLESGAARPVPELWTVDGLFARALDVIGPQNARVTVVLPDDSPAVSVDPTQLEHVLVNLLENALKFPSPDDAIDVRAERAAGEVVIRVTDRGPGIPVHEQEQIFEPFVRGESSDRAQGSGLGLAIARGFVEVNGGRLWVESQPGRGSTFALALPALETPPGALA